MDRLIYTAMTGASQTLNRQAAVAHNLANASSTGYRAEEHRLRAVQVQSAAWQKGLATRAFAVDASTHTDFASGPMVTTDRPLDMAVRGTGWIALQMPDGSEAYTRDGSFELDVNGIIQTRSGVPVQGDGGPITVPPEQKISVGVDGTISTLPESGAQNTVSVIGRVKLVNPPVADMVRGRDGLFRLRDGSAAPVDENVKIATGALEGSNVNPAEQMVAMISLARQFEMQMKMLSTADANDRAATQILALR
ncbi:MAG: flagellar basal-body rod protein FlgF [Sulfuritalea sp.]|jgi:flagellar basal-body rod protein FlgF|nr:flagellar basal-body rod protein FlgF [Azonexus sp.]MCC7310395.1 flagellar basal-body rod protein FlgF [Sulfuritalea sp.]